MAEKSTATQSNTYESTRNDVHNDTASTSARDAEVAKKKLRSERKKLENEISNLLRARTYQQQALDAKTAVLNGAKTMYIQYATEHPKPRSVQEIEHLAGLEANVTALQKEVNKMTSDIKTLDGLIKKNQDKIKDINKKLKGNPPATSKPKPKGDDKPPAGGKGGSQGDAPVAKKTEMSDKYQYNAPMVKEAYFTFNGIQDKLQDGNVLDKFKYDDAYFAWKGQVGGIGTIQMDRDFVAEQAPAISGVQGVNNIPKFDPQMYGFRFLYNPTSVGMAWQQMAQTVPSFEISGQDKSVLIAPGLVGSTVAFSLLLNRIEDFNHIDKNGDYVFISKDELTAGGRGTLMAQEMTGALTESINKLSQDLGMGATSYVNDVLGPYPTYVPREDRKMIYERGTMYDLEYLFRTIMGPHANFKTALNGISADKGWMRPTVVELHLGAGMRYRARVVELSINHAVFNSRMVPILSTVNMTLHRFNDYSTKLHSSRVQKK